MSHVKPDPDNLDERPATSVLFSLLDAGVGGGQNVALSVARELVQQGHQTGLVVPKDGPAAEQFRGLGAQVHEADIHSLRNAGQTRNLVRHLRSYDVLYSHTSIPGEILGEVAARIARRPHVIHRHTPPHFSANPATRRVQHTLYRGLMTRPRLIAVAPHIQQALVRLGVPSDRIEIVTNGVDVEAIQPVPLHSGEHLRVGLLGRFDASKGMDVFAEAVAIIGPRVPGVHFVLGGSPGPSPGFEASVRERAREVGVEIEAPGGQGVAFLSSLDIVVMPSRREGLPLVLLEAMALAKPVVGSRIDGIAEVLDDAGLLAPPESPEQLGAAIARLVGNPGLCAELGARARTRVVERFSLAMASALAADTVLTAAAREPWSPP